MVWGWQRPCSQLGTERRSRLSPRPHKRDGSQHQVRAYPGRSAVWMTCRALPLGPYIAAAAPVSHVRAWHMARLAAFRGQSTAKATSPDVDGGCNSGRPRVVGGIRALRSRDERRSGAGPPGTGRRLREDRCATARGSAAPGSGPGRDRRRRGERQEHLRCAPGTSHRHAAGDRLARGRLVQPHGGPPRPGSTVRGGPPPQDDPRPRRQPRTVSGGDGRGSADGGDDQARPPGTVRRFCGCST